MVKKRNTTDDKISNKKSTNKLIDYAAQTASIHTSQTDNLTNDELIFSLADSHENKRARQVIEWETLRRKTLSQTA